MYRRSRLRPAALAAAATAALVVVGILTAPTASADVAGPYFATTANRSDPHIIRCEHPNTGHNGYCLYASKDLGQSYAYPPLNYYPMRNTYLHYSPNGYSDWERVGGGSGVAHESDLPWVPSGAYHQWAPAATEHNGYYYLYVPNVSDKGDPGIHQKSKIGVWRADDAFGPYDLYGDYVSMPNGIEPAYMSDPEVYVEGSSRLLIWADGDYSSCGGFKIGQLNSNMRSVAAGTINTITISGSNVLGNCGGKGRPYLEGASIFKFNESSMPGPYTLVFPAKPESVPAECQTGVGGLGTANEVIAYATASSLSQVKAGNFTYRGIIMCGSTTEWTNQATIMKVTTPSGKKPWVIVYHDSPANIKERKLHAECLFAGGGKIAGVYRQALDAANGFDDCIDNVNFDYSGLWVESPTHSHPTILSAPSAGASDVQMSRYAVGAWERFQLINISGDVYAIRALANGKYVCASTSSTPLKASCTSSGATAAQFEKVDLTGDEFLLQSLATGNYVGWSSGNKLTASYNEQGTAWAARFTEMHLR